MATRPLEAWRRLRAEADFLQATRRLVEDMLDDGGPSAGRLAEAAGMGLRTLQRRLAREGTSFSALVDDARRRRALDDIAGGGVPIAEIAGTLGYASPSALTRAVRRWSGRRPARCAVAEWPDAVFPRRKNRLRSAPSRRNRASWQKGSTTAS